MNYIKQLNTFFELLITNPLDTNSQCLYLNLLHINNKCNWQKEFAVANSTLMGFTSLNKGQLDRARNNLVQKNFIKYTKGQNKKIAPIYEIIKLDIQNDTVNDTVDDTVNDTVNELKTGTLYKHKQKQNNKLNEFNLYNNFDENVCCDCISKSTKQKCGRRSTYNINGMNYCNQHSRPIISRYLGKKENFIAPSFEEVNAYVEEKQLNVDVKYFYDYFTDGNWIDSKGNPVRNWKQKILTWSKHSNNNVNVEVEKEKRQKIYNERGEELQW